MFSIHTFKSSGHPHPFLPSSNIYLLLWGRFQGGSLDWSCLVHSVVVFHVLWLPELSGPLFLFSHRKHSPVKVLFLLHWRYCPLHAGVSGLWRWYIVINLATFFPCCVMQLGQDQLCLLTRLCSDQFLHFEDEYVLVWGIITCAWGLIQRTWLAWCCLPRVHGGVGGIWQLDVF